MKAILSLLICSICLIALAADPPAIDQLNAAVAKAISDQMTPQSAYFAANGRYLQILTTNITPDGVTGTLTARADQYTSADGNQPGVCAVFIYDDGNGNRWMFGTNFVVNSQLENWRNTTNWIPIK